MAKALNKVKVTVPEDEDESGKKSKQRKEMISIRMDPDVLRWFREKSAQNPGGSYQRMINSIARDYMERNEEE